MDQEDKQPDVEWDLDDYNAAESAVRAAEPGWGSNCRAIAVAALDAVQHRLRTPAVEPEQNALNEQYNEGFTAGYHNGKAEARKQAIPMLLWCPECGARHIERAEFVNKVHHTHACQECGHVWRPAIVPTLGVKFLPGFKNKEPDVIDPVWALLQQWKEKRGTLWTTQIAELEAAFAAQIAGAP